MSQVQKLNLENLNCPIPILKTHAMLKKLVSSNILEITCTDPLTLKDIPLFCKNKGYLLLEQRIDNNKYFFRIQKP